MAKICFGGSFNPIHNGHLICARAAAEAVGADSVVLVPACQSPHKIGQTGMATAEHRLRMCHLAIAGAAGFEIDDRELHRSGPSYTIDTVRQLRREGWKEVPWLIGADMVQNFMSWREPLDLLREARILVMARPGWALDWDKAPAELQSLRGAVVTAPMIDISSTDIRSRVNSAKPIDFLTPGAVGEYILRNGLYRGIESLSH
jgi:nicotinate-nucleotide adenylyltransferase